MHNRYLILLLSILSAALQAAETESVAYLFSVNLSTQGIDFRLGEETQPVFQKINLAPDSVTVLVPVDVPGSYNIFLRESGKETWFYTADQEGNPNFYTVVPGWCHCICMDPRGKVHYYTLELPADEKPAICFLNGTEKTIAGMRLGTDWGNTPAIALAELSPFHLAGFKVFHAGDYSLFWQLAEQAGTGGYFAYPDEQGSGFEVFHFQGGEYYLFMVAAYAGDYYAVLYNITPE